MERTTFEVEVIFPDSISAVKRYVFIESNVLLFYQSKREFLLNKESYDEAFLLVRPDNVSFIESQNNAFFSLDFKYAYNSLKVRVPAQQKLDFVGLICKQAISNKNAFMKEESLPDPLIVHGIFSLNFVKRTGNNVVPVTDDQKTFSIKSSILNFEVKHVVNQKAIYIPMLNVFDVYHIYLGKQNFVIQAQEIIELETNKRNLYREIGIYNLFVQTWIARIHAFTAPPLINYHENRKMEVSISNNIDELKLASN